MAEPLYTCRPVKTAELLEARRGLGSLHHAARELVAIADGYRVEHDIAFGVPQGEDQNLLCFDRPARAYSSLSGWRLDAVAPNFDIDWRRDIDPPTPTCFAGVALVHEAGLRVFVSDAEPVGNTIVPERASLKLDPIAMDVQADSSKNIFRETPPSIACRIFRGLMYKEFSGYMAVRESMLDFAEAHDLLIAPIPDLAEAQTTAAEA